MGRRKHDYYVRLARYRDGKPEFDLTVDGRRHRLKARTKEEAEPEGKARYEQIKAEAATATSAPTIKAKPGTLRDGMALYQESDAWDLYKPLTHRQMRSSMNAIMTTPASSGGRLLGESLLADWLHDVEATDSVKRIMALCGKKYGAANHRLKALNNFFTWLLGDDDPQQGEARLRLKVGKHARNPCLGVAKAKPKRGADGKISQGHTPFTRDQVADWLVNAKDDPEEHRTIRLLLMVGGRTSDLHRLGRHMIRTTPAGRFLEFTCEKGKGSAFRKSRVDSVARVPLVPELEALIAEIPEGRLCFIHSEWGRPFACAESLGNRIRKWRRAAGLPEGLSAHGMRKAATHWWLRHHRDLIKSVFDLKTIFGWMTDKEVERYTADFDREEAVRGMLVNLADRRRA